MSRLGDVLMVAGAAWAVIACAGALRFDDVYSRMHAATKTTTLALLIVLVGAMTRLEAADAAKLALVGLLVFVTAPVGAHLIGRSIHHSPGDVRIRIDTVDELTNPPDDVAHGGDRR
jgi:multicomponent Na+:H+ antiporter subunit G